MPIGFAFVRKQRLVFPTDHLGANDFVFAFDNILIPILRRRPLRRLTPALGLRASGLVFDSSGACGLISHPNTR
jgi:hypothetical protein